MTETEEWITYHIGLPDGERREYKVSVLTGLSRKQDAAPLPEWTKLSFHRCKHCTLPEGEHTHCPLAVSMTELVDDSKSSLSHDNVSLNVISAHRQITVDTTLQRALSSLLGLVMATSACPSMRFFRPMARFHLPVSTQDETMFRVISTYMMARFFLNGGMGEHDNFATLVALYRDLREINMQIAKRIQSAENHDAATNAVVLLHVLTCVLPLSMDESLHELRLLFGPAVSQLRLAELDSEFERSGVENTDVT